MLPSLQLLEKIQQKIKYIPNQRKESKRRVHYCCYLLCEKAGLRVSEALNFDLATKTKKSLYRITKSKGNKKRFVYIPKQVISELKKYSWKPKQTNRFNFYHFLKKIKRELNLPANIELTPHTLRRAFATYHAENGLPLPLLSKLLGHKSVRTTALYWQNIYNDDNGDITSDILTGKNWLEKPKQPQPEPATPIKVKLDGLPEPLTPDLPLFSPIQAEHLTKISQLKEWLSQIQRETKLLEAQNNNLKTELAQEKKQNADLHEQNTTLCQEKAQATTKQEQTQQDLAEAQQAIKQLEQKLTNEREKRTTAENNLLIERKSNQSLQGTNANLTQKLSNQEQNYTNSINAYQQALKDKQNTQKQLNQLMEEIKTFAKTLAQWQKLNYYQQLEKEQKKFKAQIVQPPPWKTK